MIRSLTGTIKDITENSLVVEVNSVGYLVACSTLSHPFSLEQELTLHTYLAVRENSLDLYGFVDKTALQMFELLLDIPKVGPKSALQILNQATPKLIIEAVHKNDSAYLHKLSGLGKKTCENIVDYLHKKINNLPASFDGAVVEDGLSQIQTDAIDVLISLGYEVPKARSIIIKISVDDSTVNTLVTEALKQL